LNTMKENGIESLMLSSLHTESWAQMIAKSCSQTFSIRRPASLVCLKTPRCSSITTRKRMNMPQAMALIKCKRDNNWYRKSSLDKNWFADLSWNLVPCVNQRSLAWIAHLFTSSLMEHS
jgi:3-methyladenine DNA glycosylase AlkC